MKNKDYEILLADRNTSHEAERRIKDHTYQIYTADDLENDAFEIAGRDADYAEEIRSMVSSGIALTDWSICTYEGKKYYIAYQN